MLLPIRQRRFEKQKSCRETAAFQLFGSMPTGRSQKEDRHQDQKGNDGDGAPFHEIGVAVIDADMGFGEFVIVTLQTCLLGIWGLGFFKCIAVGLSAGKCEINPECHTFDRLHIWFGSPLMPRVYWMPVLQP